MRLVTNDPMEYLIWLLFSILGVGVFIGVIFLIAWFQVYVIPAFKKWGKK